MLGTRPSDSWTIPQKRSSTEWEIKAHASPDAGSLMLLQVDRSSDEGSIMMTLFSSLVVGDTLVIQL